ncbi:uncharacterized protein JCM10292_002015 [Rhodotorula paludigena]|uniref:uncharacterized protein n=1 Tax=Rhodotorula paludigena TaxID=86838 RepID=UPI003174B194
MPVVTRARSSALSSAASSPYPPSAPPRPQRKPVKKPKKVENKTATSPAPPTARSSRKRSLDDDIPASTGRIDDEEVDAGRPLKRSKIAPAATSNSAPSARKSPSAVSTSSADVPSPALPQRKRTALSREQEDIRSTLPLAPPAYSHKRRRGKREAGVANQLVTAEASASGSSCVVGMQKGKKVTTVAAPRNVLAAADQAEPVDDRAEAEPTKPARIQEQHDRKKRTAQPARTTAAAPIVPALPLPVPFSRFGISAALAQSARAMESAAHATAKPRSAPTPSAGARGVADGLADMREKYYSRFRQYAGNVSQARGNATIALVQETGSKALYLATTFQGPGMGQKTYQLVARHSLPSPFSSGLAAAGPSGATAVELGRATLQDVAHSSLEGLVDQASKMLNGGASFETVKAKLVRLAHSRDQGRFSASNDSPDTSKRASPSNGLTITDGSD